MLVWLLTPLAATTPAPPVFPLQWSANVHSVVVQTGRTQTSDCSFAFDYVNNLTAYRNCTGSSANQVVTDYKSKDFGTFGKHYYISAPGGKYPTGMCMYWCDASGDLQENMEETLMSFDYRTRAKYDSSTTLDGIAVDVFKWIEPLAVVSMADQALYVETNQAVPLYRDHHLHPFGKDLAHIYTNYTNFAAGAPDPSYFDIPNLKYCQQGDISQCGDGATGRTRFEHLAHPGFVRPA